MFVPSKLGCNLQTLPVIQGGFQPLLVLGGCEDRVPSGKQSLRGFSLSLNIFFGHALLLLFTYLQKKPPL